METPEILNQVFLGISNWKWLALVLGIVVLYSIRSAVVWICLKIKKNQARFEEKSFLHFFFEQKIEKPVSWVILAVLAFALIEYLALPTSLTTYVGVLLKLLLTFNVIRICYMAAEAFGESMVVWAKTTESEFDDQMAPFASRTLKVVIVIIGILVGLQNFGVNVTALLAGLGIGGVALAFAAQDTVANVFGTITIILDRPFKLGDHIKVGDSEGLVEEVGFRSTRIRTLYNSVVSIPNSVVAKERIDNMSARQGWIRFRHTLGFNYEASLEQINTFAEHLHYQLLQDPSVDRQRIGISLHGFGDSSLNVLVTFHYLMNADETELQRSKIYLELIMQTANDKKLSFAFPTRTLLMTNVPTTPASKGHNL